ncbi:hypothetical protein CP336_29730 [Pseudomonas fluorescens]|nr:hypothetical protein CP336_29730 [Pseudomonas fluorescens]
MLEKVIKPCAIVPQNLYVYREADQQLRQIIRDMGRPGYVLVSRQMGKTNLLLNAKRETDSESDSFAYLDVSNSFNDIRDFFRNIVDTILDGDIDNFPDIFKKIQESRKESIQLQPHKEHEFELRTILSSITGKIIICLDEIDALTKVDYSDKVFSQIRSMYFSGRTNFPDFARLTYVLSGVADPSELIKNKAISPFNIGAKIYLNDFTFQETLQFIEQCSMDLDKEIVERIYYWTSGNPRVSWEICSELESIILSGLPADPSTVDDLVSSLYLSNFDLPPVDHIRTITAADREISSAVMSIHYGKADSLTDKVKDRLYLAGITTSKAADGSIRFRNKIVAEAVSEKWISEVENSLLSVSDRVLQYFEAEDFDGIITLYEKNYDDECDDISRETQFKIGYAYVKADLHAQALAIFKQASSGVEAGEDYYIFNYWMGVCNLVTGDIKSAINNFSPIVYRENAQSQGVDYYQACLNLSVANFRDVFENEYSQAYSEQADEIEKTLNEVINSEDKIKNLRSEIVAKQLSYSAYYQLHTLHAWKKDSKSAIAALDSGIQHCVDSSIIKFLIAKIPFLASENEKNESVERCVNEIVERELTISLNRQNNSLLLTLDDVQKILFYLAMNGSYDSFAKLVNYLFETEKNQGHACASILHSAAIRAARVKNHAALFWITNSSVALLTGRAKKEDLRKLISLSLIMAAQQDVGDLKEKFLQDFLSDDGPLPLSDLSAIYVLVMSEIEHNNINAARNIINSSISGWAKNTDIDDEDKNWKLADSVLRYLAVVVSTLERNFIELPKLIDLKSEIETLHDQTLPYFTKDANNTIIKTLEAIINFQNSSLIKNKLDGINRRSIVTVRLKDGRLKTGQLKKFLKLIESGQATLITQD